MMGALVGDLSRGNVVLDGLSESHNGQTVDSVFTELLQTANDNRAVAAFLSYGVERPSAETESAIRERVAEVRRAVQGMSTLCLLLRPPGQLQQ